MRVLITRPGDDGAALSRLLAERGIESVLEPLLSIDIAEGPEIPLDGVQAVLMTSANGVRALVQRSERRDIPVYTVGDATARTAREAGFTQVHSASGDLRSLAKLASEGLDPAGGELVHVSASEVAGDLSALMSEAGFACRREVLYSAEPARSLSPSAIGAVKDGRVDSIILFSPRTADVLVDLIRKARLVRSCRSLDLICLSQAVADTADSLKWRNVHVAAEPTQDAMLDLLTSLAEASAPGDTAEGPAAGPEEAGPRAAPQASSIPEAHMVAPIQQGRPGALKIVFFTLLTLVVVFGAAAASFPLWQSQLAELVPVLSAGDSQQNRIDELTERLAELERRSGSQIPDLAQLQSQRDRLQAELNATLERLGNLERSIDTVRKSIADIDSSDTASEAQAALRNLTERLSRLEADEARTAAGTSDRIDRLTTQLAALEKAADNRAADDDENTGRFVFAVSRLRETARLGEPYAVELAVLKNIAGENSDVQGLLKELEPAAETGLPTLSSLRGGFDDIAGELVRVERIPPGDSLVRRTLARLSQSIKWRRVDDLDGASVDAVVARAERALSRADVVTAIQELAKLPPGAAERARVWVASAESHVAAERVLKSLQERALAVLEVKRNTE